MSLREFFDFLKGRPVFSRKDLARWFGCTERTIDRWRAQGLLPKPRYVHGPYWTAQQVKELDIELNEKRNFR